MDSLQAGNDTKGMTNGASVTTTKYNHDILNTESAKRDD